MYSGNGAAQGILVRGKRAGTNNYLIRASRVGDIVRSTYDGRWYECIADHFSAATAATPNTGQPGECTGWETNWRYINVYDRTSDSTSAFGSFPNNTLGGANWAINTGYDRQDERFEVGLDGSMDIYNDITIWNSNTNPTTSVEILSGSGDPAAGGGTPASQGSLYLRRGASAVSAALYVKHGALDTDWSPLTG
jgi:hypothetical protein